VIVLLPEGLKALNLGETVAGPLQQILFGVLIIVLMFLRPQGLVGQPLRVKAPRRPSQKASDQVAPSAA